MKNRSKPEPARGMVITDLDGTLLRTDGQIDAENIEAFHELGTSGITRVIATGRSLFSLRRVLSKNFPIDYIVFSTGAGIIEFPSGRLLKSSELQPTEVCRAATLFQNLRLDFSIQHPIPSNHRFAYWLSGRNNPDFMNRLELYRECCTPLPTAPVLLTAASQLIAIMPPDEGTSTLDIIQDKLPELTVIRATSPLDNKSIWVEIFPTCVCKSSAALWLSVRLGIPTRKILAVGNDYNDLDLLDFSEHGFVVDNAPEELKSRYPSVASNNHCGVAEAIHRWTKIPGIFQNQT